jgi:hypothetical protein
MLECLLHIPKRRLTSVGPVGLTILVRVSPIKSPEVIRPFKRDVRFFYTYQLNICRELDCYVVKSRNCSALATFPLSMVVQSSLRRSDGTSCHGTSTIPAS